MSPVAKEIFEAVKLAMQEAEEIGGPEGDDYVDLMRAIAEEASKRKKAFQEHRCIASELGMTV